MGLFGKSDESPKREANKEWKPNLDHNGHQSYMIAEATGFNPSGKSLLRRSYRNVKRNKGEGRGATLPQPIPAVPLCSNLKEILKFKVRTGNMENLNPKVHTKSEARVVTLSDYDEGVVDEIDSREVFDMIRDINDPEHPLTLEELNVLEEDKIVVDNVNNFVKVSFTPTIPHCSMATLIGLAIRVQLMRSLPSRFKVDIAITPGSHASEFAINKQLADKERVAAALENAHLIEVVNQCLTIKGY